MISKRMEDALNHQINREYYSGLFYLSMSAHAGEAGYKGIAKWFMIQYHEEIMHAMKIYQYVQARGGQVEFMNIEAPPKDYTDMTDLFTRTLEHEQSVTAMVNNLMNTAIEEKDHAAQIFLQWYVTEQVEEEENVNDILTRIKMINGDIHAMLMLDNELAQRITTVATDFSNGLPEA